MQFHDLVEGLVEGQDAIARKASRSNGPEATCPGCARRYKLGEKHRLRSCPICGGRLDGSYVLHEEARR